MRERLLKFLNRVLSTDVTPLVYLVLLHTSIFGGSFLFFSDSKGVQTSALAQLGIPFGFTVWASLVFGGSVVTFLGVLLKRVSLISFASMAVFAAWLMAAITYFKGHLFFQGALAIVLCLEYAYFFLAANIGRLWNYTPDRG